MDASRRCDIRRADCQQTAKVVLVTEPNQWIGQSRHVQAAFAAATEAARGAAAVLIVGERGVGKELLARIIHQASARAADAFVTLNCGALGDRVGAELFGHAVEAAAGHVGPSVGLLERTGRGTLLLDEVTRMSAGLQARLADALNRGVYQRLGSIDEQPLNARVMAASHIDVRTEREQGRFREDLLYSFGVQIYIPPLRQRPDDIPLLARFFLDCVAGMKSPGITDEALAVMRRYDWPGNVRQLRNAMERAWAASRSGPITPAHLPAEVTGRDEVMDIAEHEDLTIAALERRHIRHVLQLTGGKLSEAAELLGIHRNTLRRKLEEYGIS